MAPAYMVEEEESREMKSDQELIIADGCVWVHYTSFYIFCTLNISNENVENIKMIQFAP